MRQGDTNLSCDSYNILYLYVVMRRWSSADCGRCERVPRVPSTKYSRDAYGAPIDTARRLASRTCLPSPLVPTLNVHYPYPTPTLPLPLLADRVKRYITTPILPLPRYKQIE